MRLIYLNNRNDGQEMEWLEARDLYDLAWLDSKAAIKGELTDKKNQQAQEGTAALPG